MSAQTVGKLDDNDLLRRICAHDQTAFRSLLERHIDRAYSLAFRILGNAADAEDVVQDAFLRVWTHRDRWEPGRAQFSTWLYRVVTNRCIDFHRQARAAPIEIFQEPVEEQWDTSTKLASAEIHDILDDAVGRLPLQQRAAIILCYYHGLSNREIAGTMETTIKAVESLLKRGRRHLREILGRRE